MTRTSNTFLEYNAGIIIVGFEHIVLNFQKLFILEAFNGRRDT